MVILAQGEATDEEWLLWCKRRMKEMCLKHPEAAKRNLTDEELQEILNAW